MPIDPIAEGDLNRLYRQVKSFSDQGIPYVESQSPVRVKSRRRQVGADAFVRYDRPELLDKGLLNYVRHYAYSFQVSRNASLPRHTASD